MKKNYDLPEEEKYDVIPEFWQGHNFADYIEEMREKAGAYDSDESEDDEELEEIRDLASKIRIKKKLLKNEQRTNNTKKPVMGRTTAPLKRQRSVSRLKREFEELGVDMTGTEDANFTRTNERTRSR